MNNSDGTPEISTTGSGKRRWILATLCLSVLLVSMDNMIVNVALPDIGRSMDAPTSTLQWVVDGYVVSFAGLLLTAGHLGDHFGRRRVMQIGLVVFALASVLASTGSTARTLIAARALMGAGAALVYPSTLAILTAEFTDPHRRAAAIGVWSGVSGMGLALGPVLGGLLMRRFAWDSVFTVNIPIAVIALVAGRIVLPESRGCVRSPLDVVGAALSLVSIALLVATIIEAPGPRLALGVHPGLGRCRGGAADSPGAASAPRRAPSRRSPSVQRPAVHRGGLRAGHRLLRAVRLHLPHHHVPPAREGLRPADGRCGDAALRGRHGGRLTALPGAGPALGDALGDRRRDGPDGRRSVGGDPR
ncbi:MAG: MFS transporter [Acidipropionibacterium sp.]|jgi:hypothetical protein|nr:MFS transporter [Acidipropionibacterium sp.]